MRTYKLFRAIGDVDSDLVEAADTPVRRTPLRLMVLRWGAAAACLALIASAGVHLLLRQPAAPPIPQLPANMRAELPAGPRKFLNWGGYRYAFAGDGAAYDFSGFAMGEPLGLLEHAVPTGWDSEEEDSAALDRATTWALGGNVYAIPGYDPGFRLAVEKDGAWYLAELVARVDDVPLDAGAYFQVSDLRSLVRDAWILPHNGEEQLHAFGIRKARSMVDILAGAQPAAMDNTRYEALARAQGEGRSWRLSLRLLDDTAVDLYIVPELKLISIGDSYYELPDEFAIAYGNAFDSLPQQAPPAY